MSYSLSVIVVILQGAIKLQRCLTALENQAFIGRIEIIVPYDDNFPLLEQLLRPKFPDVRFVKLEGERTYAECRSMAVHLATGDIVAITEDHCIPQPEWAVNIIASHAQPHAVVGGAVDKLTPDTPLNWSLYLADYARYMNPRPAGPTHELTDCNVTYKRAALDAIAPVWQTEFHEPEVHGALAEQGNSLWFAPNIIVQQQRSMALAAAVQDRYAFGRLFGSRRARGMSLIKRLTLLSMTSLLPLLLTWRAFGHIRRTGRGQAEFRSALPYLLLLNTTWAAGEFLGYLTGRSAPQLTATHGNT